MPEPPGQATTEGGEPDVYPIDFIGPEAGAHGCEIDVVAAPIGEKNLCARLEPLIAEDEK